MNIILDTHLFLWWLEDNKKLPASAKKIIADPDNVIFISSATIWEISIKKSLEKLVAKFNFQEEMVKNDFLPLSINFEHALFVEELPFLHKDPFDRILIAQTIIEKYYLLTSDPVLKKYSDRVISVT